MLQNLIRNAKYVFWILNNCLRAPVAIVLCCVKFLFFSSLFGSQWNLIGRGRKKIIRRKLTNTVSAQSWMQARAVRLELKSII
jgi:hypothetical protein